MLNTCSFSNFYKMKFLLQTFIIIILTAIIQILLPWWGLMIACFVVAFFAYSTRSISFFSSFLGVGILWIAYAYYVDTQTSSILTVKVAQIFKLPNTSYLILITGLVGGIAAGFSALTGHLFREFFTRKEFQD